MKNPFAKKDHTLLIAAIAAGAVTAGALAYLYLTESGNETRDTLSVKLKDLFKEAAADVISKKTKFSKKAAKVVADHVV